MAYTDLFAYNPLSMGGIKTLKLAVSDNNYNPLSFPLDIVLKDSNQNIVVASDDQKNRLITLGATQIKYRIVYPLASSFIENEIDDRQGTYYEKKLDFEMPKLNLTTMNQLKDFLFTTSGDFAISNVVAFVKDTNNNDWIIGWDYPLILKNFNLQTDIDDGQNKYVLSYVSKSYQRIRQIEYI